MAGTNQFVPYASAAGANTLAPDAYAAAPARQSGQIAGRASSILSNTAWRQSSTMAAMLGQFIATQANLNAQDNGDITTLMNSFIAGLNATFSAAIPGIAPTSLWHVGNDTGAQNALVVSAIPALTEYTPYVVVQTKVAATNTGAATINVNALGAKVITRADGSTLKAGDMIAGELVTLLYDGTNFQISGLLTANLPSSGTVIYGGNDDVSGSQTGYGTFVYNLPPGVRIIKRVKVWGGGGSGGGSTGSNSGGSGGGGGGYAEAVNINVAGATSLTITVGKGGAAAINSNGTTGGTSSVAITGQSAFIQATGGGFGYWGNNTTASAGLGVGGIGSGPGLNAQGGTASFPFLVGVGTGSGFGGAGAFGGSTPTINIGGGSASGNFPGGGSNGGSNGSDASRGANGLITLEI